jgi:hypothetical protein
LPAFPCTSSHFLNFLSGLLRPLILKWCTFFRIMLEIPTNTILLLVILFPRKKNLVAWELKTLEILTCVTFLIWWGGIIWMITKFGKWLLIINMTYPLMC